MWKWTFVFAVALLAQGVLAEEDQQLSDEEENCECVPYYQCDHRTIIDDGNTLIDIRLRTCDDYMQVCCNAPTSEVPSTPFPTLVTHKEGCGHRNPGGVGFRITGAEDNEAQFGEFPWMVAVMRVEVVDPPEGEEVSTQELNVYQCGGSLIHPKVVLTGAHCVAGKEDLHLKIRAGEWDTQTLNEIYGHQDRDVESFVVHEHFGKRNLFNNVALLFLSQPVDPAENIGFACVPQQSYLPPPSTLCFATGWGKDVFGRQGVNQVILKKVDLPVVDNTACQATLRKTALGRYFRLHHSFMCAGGEQGKDTCKGDGGSPLVCPLPDNAEKYIQSGIVSWGIGCGENQVPGVYANVGHFRNWIDGKMQEAQLDTAYYSY